ncbi:MAG TPA: hypothetical protein VKC15_13950 [Gemmatimonadales bacterium]|nr:hypothetical protein [Gemmatimonadales bacterium]
MRASISVALVVVTTVTRLAAQGSTALTSPGRLCLHAEPKPACSVFLLTNAGAYVMFSGNSSGETAARGVLDYGFMVNLNTRDAIGGSLFASVDRDGFAVGPSVRYRRWLTPVASLEVAVGKPLAGDQNMRTGAVFGLVKWSPNHWFALAARPEVARQYQCGPSTCSWRSGGRVSVGTEIGALPGLAVTGAAAVGFAAFIVVLASAFRD